MIPVILTAAINGIYLTGVGSWRPVFYERTYGLIPARYGLYSGLVFLLTAPVGVWVGSLLIKHMARRWDDAHMRLVVWVHALTLPIWILGPLMPTYQWALGLQIVSGTLVMVSAPASLSAMQIITPNEMRAQVNAVYMVTVGVLGPMFGPTAFALITDYVFRSEAALRYTLSAAAAVATPLMLVIILQAVKPFGALHRQVIEAEGRSA